MGGKGGQGHRHTVAAKQTSCVTLRHLTSDFHQVTMSGAPPAWRAEGTDLHTHWERSADVTLRGLPLTHRKPLFSGPHQQYNADGAWVLTIAFVSPDNTNPPGNPHLQGRRASARARAGPLSRPRGLPLGHRTPTGFTLKGAGFSDLCCTNQDNYCRTVAVRKALGV